MTTLILILLFLGTLICSWLLCGIILNLVLRQMKVSDVTVSRIIMATAVAFAIQIALTLFFRLAPPVPRPTKLFLLAIEFGLVIFLPCLGISRVFHLTIGRSTLAWFATLLPSLVLNLLLAFTLRYLMIEAFYIPTNGMAPTLLGDHCQAVCPECSQPNYCSHREAVRPYSDAPNLICTNFHVSQMMPPDLTQFPGDHVITLKFLTPRRWDIVVFRYPADPRSSYAMRLVGLPGETLHIEDGAVWINGQKLEPPASLRGNQFLDQIPGVFADMSGTKGNPAILGHDEYFVLGDFSPQSNDSRLWHEGAPGHPPYAVPHSHVKGVITHIYWPPSRWHIFR